MGLCDILRKFEERGWNVYEGREEETIRDFVPRGPTRELSPGKVYITLPAVASPKNIEDVETVVMDLDRKGEIPVATYGGSRYFILFFRVDEDKVTIANPESNKDTAVSYNMFEKILENLRLSPTCSIH